MSADQPREFAGLRRRLTLWYVGTYSAIFLLLAVSLVYVIGRQISGELDRLIHETVQEAIRGANVRVADGMDVLAAAREAVAEVQSPNRPVYLFDRAGVAQGAVVSDPGVQAIALSALREGDRDTTVTTPTQTWRLFARRFELQPGASFVAVAAASTDSVQRQYRHVLEAFAAAGIAAIGLVGLGGYRIARLSSEPVERSVERLRRFVADAAHELRTPIALLRARAEVTLRHERDADAYAAALESMARETERLGRIADDLLTLARADAGDRPIARDRFYLDDLLADTVAAAGALATSRDVSLELGRYEETPVVGDASLLRQLFVILIDNAIQFTPAGGTITADVFIQGEIAVVEVRDTGSGIDPAALPRIFDRFYRADPARGRTGGAGLGLSIARWIADRHGAQLSLVPGAEVGTIARFSMRRAL
jgi:signal transduction histidine kinase